MSKDLRTVLEQCYNIAEEHGWHKNIPDFGTLLMLIVSEAAEALEDFRNHWNPEDMYYECKADKHYRAQNCLGIVIQDNETKDSKCTTCIHRKPCGIPSELADIIIRTADVAGIFGIDLAAAVLEKMEYNKNRPYRHGNKKV